MVAAGEQGNDGAVLTKTLFFKEKKGALYLLPALAETAVDLK